MGPASLALARFQVAFSVAFDFVLFLHAPLVAMVLSCFFMRFLLLWLCTVSPCFPSAELEFIFIHLCKRIIGFLPYIGLGLLTPFAFIHYIELGLLILLLYFLFIYSLHWVKSANPFYFLFSSFIRYIGLG